MPETTKSDFMISNSRNWDSNVRPSESLPLLHPAHEVCHSALRLRAPTRTSPDLATVDQPTRGPLTAWMKALMTT